MLPKKRNTKPETAVVRWAPQRLAALLQLRPGEQRLEALQRKGAPRRPEISSLRKYLLNGFRKSTPHKMPTYCLLLLLETMS
jgi:hypothetical protein